MPGQYTVHDLGLDFHLNRDSNLVAFNTENPTDTVGAMAMVIPGSVNASDISAGEIPQILFYAKQTFSDTTNGMRQGFDPTDGLYKWIIGDATSSIDWNVTTANTLTVIGSITTSSGTIGGFSIGSDFIRDAADSFGMASTVTGGDDVRFWAGDTFANRSTAPYRVTEAGVLTARSGTIGGWTLAAATISGGSITIDSAGNIRAGQTAYDTGTGWFIEGGATPRMSLGNSAGNKFTYDGTDFIITGGNFLVNTSTGRVTVTQVSTTGNTISATRNLTATSTDSPVVSIIQDHLSDDQPALQIRQDSSTPTVPALYVETGRVGIGVAAPTQALDVSGSVNISSALTLGTDLAVAEGGTGASTAASARTNLGLAIGSDVQAWDTNLDQIAALAVTDSNFIVGNGAAWVVETGATARTSLGLGTMATQNASAVAITGGTITGVTIATDWVQLGEFISVSAATSISVSGLSARQDLRVVIFIPSSSAAVTVQVRFNNDSGANYGYVVNAGQWQTGSTSNAQSSILFENASHTGVGDFADFSVVNSSSDKKLIMGQLYVGGSTTSGGTVYSFGGQWNDTAQVTRVDILTGTANTFAIGTRITVYGKKD